MVVIFIICVACNAEKHAILTYNHVTGETRINDSLQHPNNVDVWTHTDDELTLVIYGYKITSAKSVRYEYESQMDVELGRAYFYSPWLSVYMETDQWFIFDITYKKE